MKQQTFNAPNKQILAALNLVALRIPKMIAEGWLTAAQEPIECLDCGSNNIAVPATYDSLITFVKRQPAQQQATQVQGCEYCRRVR